MSINFKMAENRIGEVGRHACMVHGYYCISQNLIKLYGRRRDLIGRHSVSIPTMIGLDFMQSSLALTTDNTVLIMTTIVGNPRHAAVRIAPIPTVGRFEGRLPFWSRNSNQ